LPSEAVLAFDTSGSWCAVALLAGDRILAHRHEFMARGQGERLFAVIAEAMQEAGVAWTDLAAIGVGTGPGNFTGIRIGVAAARGLALGLSIPAIGIDRFTALCLDGPSLPALVPSVRGLAWMARPGAAPEQIDPARLSGRVIADPAEFPALAFTATAPAYSLAVAIARLASQRRHTPQPRPAPLYLRPADAAPASDGAPALLD
jgi:tRNA threonylcarbamoyladenosine biosynthesis protein TsaB